VIKQYNLMMKRSFPNKLLETLRTAVRAINDTFPVTIHLPPGGNSESEIRGLCNRASFLQNPCYLREFSNRKRMQTRARPCAQLKIRVVRIVNTNAKEGTCRSTS
jgi:hypothetical protein